jgi:hypothetical protein
VRAVAVAPGRRACAIPPAPPLAAVVASLRYLACPCGPVQEPRDDNITGVILFLFFPSHHTRGLRVRGVGLRACGPAEGAGEPRGAVDGRERTRLLAITATIASDREARRYNGPQAGQPWRTPVRPRVARGSPPRADLCPRVRPRPAQREGAGLRVFAPQRKR